MTTKEALEKNGFDFELFQTENEYSAKNILLAMEEYGKHCAEQAWNESRKDWDFDIWWNEFKAKEK